MRRKNGLPRGEVHWSLSFFFSTKDRLGIPQIHQIGHLVNLGQRPIQILPRVSGRYAKAGSRYEQGHGRKSDNDHGQSPFETFARKGRNLGGVKQHDGHDRRVVMPHDEQSHFPQLHSKVVGIVAQRLQLVLSDIGAVFAHDNLEGAQTLLAHHGRKGVVVNATGALFAKKFNHLLGRGNVTTHASKTLGKGSHHDINIRRIDSAVFRNTTTGWSHGTNRMGLVQVDIGSVLFAHAHDILQVAVFTFHRVNALDNHHNLVPRSPRARFALDNGLAQNFFQMLRVIVLKNANGRARCPGTADDTRVVQLVRNEQIAPFHQRRNGGGIGVETHVEYHGIFLAQKSSHRFFQFPMLGGGTVFGTGRRHANTKVLQRCLDIRTTSRHPIVGKAQIIVRSQIHTVSGGRTAVRLGIVRTLSVVVPLFVRIQIIHAAQHLQTLLSIGAHPFQHVDVRTGIAGNGSIETILHARVEAAGVKVFPTLEQRRKLGQVIARQARLLTNVTSHAQQVGAKVVNVTPKNHHGVPHVDRVGREPRDGNFFLVTTTTTLVATCIGMRRKPGPIVFGQSFHFVPNVGVGIVVVQGVIFIIVRQDAAGSARHFGIR
mmetsp:Transcript_10249/g.22542  ORF Transcript_10249/g.22542 Transcript_10249/m.22542 type:complete len:600 (+) Transcript_10249:128-1927(+)